MSAGKTGTNSHPLTREIKMADFSTSFGSKERAVKRASVARNYSHRSPIRWERFDSIRVLDGCGTEVHIMVDGDTRAVLTTQGGRMQGEPTLFTGKNASREAEACCRVLLASLRSGNDRKPTQVSDISRMVAMLQNCTLGSD